MPANLPEIPGYEILSQLGRGGMGVVYQARQLVPEQTVAIKMILSGRGAGLSELARFRIEAEAVGCLAHPNIVLIHDVGLYRGCPYFTMEFGAGGSLAKNMGGQPQPPRRAAEIVRALALAIEHAHERRILHRDLKPANVILMEDGTPKLTDFGLAKFLQPMAQVSAEYATGPLSIPARIGPLVTDLKKELRISYAVSTAVDRVARRTSEETAGTPAVHGTESQHSRVEEFLVEAQRQSRMELPGEVLQDLTREGDVMGSPQYMAPEQALGDLERIGPRTDVYGLGAILYEMLTGRPPFRDLLHVVAGSPVPPRIIEPRVARDIESVCMKCLEKSPDRRYRHAAELANDLTCFLDGYSVIAPVVDLGAAPARAADRRAHVERPATTLAHSFVPPSPEAKIPFRPSGGRKARPIDAFVWYLIAVTGLLAVTMAWLYLTVPDLR